jgi:hypothetical protein
VGTGGSSPTGYNSLFGILFENTTASSVPEGYVKVPQAYASSGTGATVKYYLVPASLKEVEVGADYFNYGAFQNCTMLETVTLSGNPTEIPMRAFKNTGITKMTIPDSVVTVG